MEWSGRTSSANLLIHSLVFQRVSCCRHESNSVIFLASHLMLTQNARRGLRGRGKEWIEGMREKERGKSVELREFGVGVEGAVNTRNHQRNPLHSPTQSSNSLTRRDQSSLIVVVLRLLPIYFHLIKSFLVVQHASLQALDIASKAL